MQGMELGESWASSRTRKKSTAFVSWGCCNQGPHPGRLDTQFILSQFCELEVSVSRAPSEGSREESFLTSSSVWKLLAILGVSQFLWFIDASL